MKIYQNNSDFYDEMGYRINSNTFKSADDPYRRNAQGISKIYHEVLLILSSLQTKPQVRSMSISCYDLYYTVMENGDDKEIVNENDYIIFDNFFKPNHFVGLTNDDAKLG